ncbi:unnamed protein product [Caenorhabditis nigoni]
MVKTLASVFNHFDHDKDGLVTLMQIKLVMEKLEEAQCHIDIKTLIEKVTKEKGGKISLEERRSSKRKRKRKERKRNSRNMAFQ